jgi:hypothetical protein
MPITPRAVTAHHRAVLDCHRERAWCREQQRQGPPLPQIAGIPAICASRAPCAENKKGSVP